MSERAPHPFSRELLLGWCLWLLACWFISGSLEGPYALPRLRMTQMMAWLGVMLVWPAWRLSVRQGPWPAVSTVCDMFSLWLGYQVLAARMLIDFPQSLRGPLIDLAFTVWLLPVGLWVFLGRQSGPRGRAGFMLLCIVTAFGGTLAAIALEQTAWTLALAPARLMWLFSSGVTPVPIGEQAIALAAVGGGWIALWGIALVGTRGARSGAATADAQASTHAA